MWNDLQRSPRGQGPDRPAGRPGIRLLGLFLIRLLLIRVAVLVDMHIALWERNGNPFLIEGFLDVFRQRPEGAQEVVARRHLREWTFLCESWWRKQQ